MTEESAQIFSGLFSIMVVSILLSFGSMYAEVEHLRQTTARRPFGFWTRARNWYHRAMYGTEAPQPVSNVHVTVEGDGKGGLALDTVEQIRRNIAKAAANYAMPKTA